MTTISYEAITSAFDKGDDTFITTFLTKPTRFPSTSFKEFAAAFPEKSYPKIWSFFLKKSVTFNDCLRLVKGEEEEEKKYSEGDEAFAYKYVLGLTHLLSSF